MYLHLIHLYQVRISTWVQYLNWKFVISSFLLFSMHVSYLSYLFFASFATHVWRLRLLVQEWLTLSYLSSNHSERGPWPGPGPYQRTLSLCLLGGLGGRLGLPLHHQALVLRGAEDGRALSWLPLAVELLQHGLDDGHHHGGGGRVTDPHGQEGCDTHEPQHQAGSTRTRSDGWRCARSKHYLIVCVCGWLQ